MKHGNLLLVRNKIRLVTNHCVQSSTFDWLYEVTPDKTIARSQRRLFSFYFLATDLYDSALTLNFCVLVNCLPEKEPVYVAQMFISKFLN